jgi:hypothetical protein
LDFNPALNNVRGVFLSSQLRLRRCQDEKGYWHNITEVIAQQVIPVDGEAQKEPASQWS